MNHVADESRSTGQPKYFGSSISTGSSSKRVKLLKRPSAMDELRDGTGNDRVLDDLERDILGAVRGVVTDFVAKRVGKPDLSDVDVDIELPGEAEQHQSDQQEPHAGPDAGREEPNAQPQRGFGPGTALLPLLLIFSFGVLVVGAGLFYSHVIVGEIPLANGTKLQSIAVERQRNEAAEAVEKQPTLTPTLVNAPPALSGTTAEAPPSVPAAEVGQAEAPSANTAGGWVTTTTPSADNRLDGFSAARPAKFD